MLYLLDFLQNHVHYLLTCNVNNKELSGSQWKKVNCATDYETCDRLQSEILNHDEIVKCEHLLVPVLALITIHICCITTSPLNDM